MVLAPLQGVFLISDTFAANFFEVQLILYTVIILHGKSSDVTHYEDFLPDVPVRLAMFKKKKKTF